MATNKKASRAGKTSKVEKTSKTAKAKSGNGRTAVRPAAKSKKATKSASATPARRTRYVPPDKEERGFEGLRDEAGRESLHWERNKQVVLGETSGKPS